MLEPVTEVITAVFAKQQTQPDMVTELEIGAEAVAVGNVLVAEQMRPDGEFRIGDDV